MKNYSRKADSLSNGFLVRLYGDEAARLYRLAAEEEPDPYRAARYRDKAHWAESQVVTTMQGGNHG